MANPNHTSNTITKVVGNSRRVRAFAQRLLEACDLAESEAEVQHVEETFQQSSFEGPWGLRIDVVSNGQR